MKNMDHWITILSFSDINTILSCFLLNSTFNKLDCNLLWNLLINRNFNEIGYSKNDYKYYSALDYFWSTINNYSDYTNKQITEIPPDWNPNVFNLHLNDNQITEIPPDWNPNVYNIYLNNNQITEIPPDWNPNVTILALNNNQITEIPPDWNPNVFNLHLNDNQITEIPLDWNPNITNLYLYRNQISEESILNFINRTNITVHY